MILKNEDREEVVKALKNWVIRVTAAPSSSSGCDRATPAEVEALPAIAQLLLLN